MFGNDVAAGEGLAVVPLLESADPVFAAFVEHHVGCIVELVSHVRLVIRLVVDLIEDQQSRPLLRAHCHRHPRAAAVGTTPAQVVGLEPAQRAELG